MGRAGAGAKMRRCAPAFDPARGGGARNLGLSRLLSGQELAIGQPKGQQMTEDRQRGAEIGAAQDQPKHKPEVEEPGRTPPKRRDPNLNDPNIDEPGRTPGRGDPNIDRPGQPPGRPDQEIDLPGPDRVPDPTRQD